MLDKKTTNSYVAEIAKEFGVTKKAARTILIFAMKNITRMVRKGEDIHLQHFGSIYFDKKSFTSYLKSCKYHNEKETRINNPSDDLGTNTEE